VLLPQFNGQLLVAFQADAPAILGEIQQSEHLSLHPKDQGGIIERKTFGDGGFRQAVFADLLDVHDSRQILTTHMNCDVFPM